MGGAGFLAGPLAYLTKSKFRLFIAFLVRNPKIFGKFSYNLLKIAKNRPKMANFGHFSQRVGA